MIGFLAVMATLAGGGHGVAAHRQTVGRTPYVIYKVEGGLTELGWLYQAVLGNIPVSVGPSPKPQFSERLDLVQQVGTGPLTGYVTADGHLGEDGYTIRYSERYRYEHRGGWPVFTSNLSSSMAVTAYVRDLPGARVFLHSKQTIVHAEGIFSPTTGGEWKDYGSVTTDEVSYGGATFRRVDVGFTPHGKSGVGCNYGNTGPGQPPFTIDGNGDVEVTYEVAPVLPARLRPGVPNSQNPIKPASCDAQGPDLNLATGNVEHVDYDPIPTRGWPLSNNIVVNSQVVEPNRPMGNATFSYDVHLAIPTVITRAGDVEQHLVLVDGDGTRQDFGIWSGSLKPPFGLVGVLRPTFLGYEYFLAGPPGDIKRPGNYRYVFDKDGALLSLFDPAGNEQRLSYGDSGLQRVLDVSTGRAIDFTWKRGRIETVVENGGAATTRLSYDSGRLVRVEVGNARGTATTTSYAYGGDGLLSAITLDDAPTPNYWITYQFVSDPQFPDSLVPYAHLFSTSSNNLNVAYRDTNRPGILKVVTQDTLEYDYDRNGQVATVEFGASYVAWPAPTFWTDHDAAGNLTRFSTESTAWNFGYDGLNNLTQSRDASGGVWNRTYIGVDLTSTSDSLGRTLSMSYSGATPHRPSTVADGSGAAWSFGYNPQGQTLSVTDPIGHSSLFSYDEDPSSPSYAWLKTATDGAGSALEAKGYDGLGDPTSIATSLTGATFDYDALHRPLLRTNANGTNFRWRYNGRRLAETVDENGLSTTYGFCGSCGQLKSVSGPLGWTLNLGYDEHHFLTSLTDARGNTTTFGKGIAYWGEAPLGVYYPDGTKRELQYDRSHRVTRATNGRGQFATIDYDASSRPAHVAYSANGSDRRFAYNLDDTLRSVSNGEGTTTYDYLPNKLVQRVTYDYRPAGLTAVQTLDYAYNGDRTVRLIVWKSGDSVAATYAYEYDGAGRVTAVTGPGGRTGYAYDADGKLVSQTNPNRTGMSVAYDEALARPSRIAYSGRESRGGTSYDLVYDDGRDTVGNLTRVTDGSGARTDYGYDALYRLTAESRPGFSRAYGYDLAGNLTGVDGSTFATYDAANKMASAPGGRPAYDLDGNLTSISGTGLPNGRFFWDADDKMIRQSSGVATVGYGYDPYGHRIWSQSGTGGKRFYVFAGNDLLGEVGPDGAVQASYTWGASGVVSETLPSKGTFWYQFGPQGETRQLTGGNGSVVATYAYSAYGVPLSATAGVVNPFRYGGRYGYYADGPNGLLLCGQRWYSPHTTRWISRDPDGSSGGTNLLSYCNESPLRFIDMDGRTPEEQAQADVENARLHGALNEAKTLSYWCSVPFVSMICNGDFYPAYDIGNTSRKQLDKVGDIGDIASLRRKLADAIMDGDDSAAHKINQELEAALHKLPR